MIYGTVLHVSCKGRANLHALPSLFGVVQMPKTNASKMCIIPKSILVFVLSIKCYIPAINPIP